MTIFEVGRDYKFRMLEDGGECTFVSEIAEVEGTLIKLKGYGGLSGEQIINTASSNFVSAEIQPYRSPEDKKKSEEDFKKLLGGLGSK